MDNGKVFNRALNNLSIEFAGRAGIRRMFDKGMTVAEIRKELLYPLSEDVIRNEIWSYLLDSRAVLLEEPAESEAKHYEFVEETNAYGKKSFNRVEISSTQDELPEYIKIGFKIRSYRDPEHFKEKLMHLNVCDREYITELPWPLEPVWHIKNERIMRICDALGEKIENAGSGT